MKISNVNDAAQFIGAYFHQDCFHCDPTIEEIVKRFQREEPAQFVASVKCQLHGLLRQNLAESELEEFLRDAGCYYDPLIEFHTHREWLEYLLQLLDKPTEDFRG
jgi:hypothetical protein